MHIIYYEDCWRKIDVHDLLEAVLTSKVAQMAWFSQDSPVNTWDVGLKAVQHFTTLYNSALWETRPSYLHVLL